MFVKHKDVKKCLRNTKPQTSGRHRKYGWKSCLQNMSAVCQSFFRRHKDMSLKICTTLIATPEESPDTPDTPNTPENSLCVDECSDISVTIRTLSIELNELYIELMAKS
ncbi:CLUMA_CG007766, isoform A [Clunio marinus]|uniref:CLUMA_CG007766, isoform A n=1 Tax=Clunio marinus TaxID=568069 RepID=A0A1J1I213_9DIPT|nr:CLUMA_CG007766, isoform A [Clunio marinus]